MNRGVWGIAVVGLAMMAIGAPSAGAATVIGETFAPSPNLLCPDDNTFIQGSGGTGGVSSPGVITSWRHEAGNTPASLKFKVARRLGGDSFLIVGESSPVALTPNALIGSPVRIPVQAGDLIGFTVSTAQPGIPCARENPGSTFYGAPGDPLPGQTATLPFSPGLQFDIAATLEPDADADGFGDETQDGCPTQAATQGACVLPETTITKAPKKKTTKREARFEFTASVPGATFECAIDGSPFGGCTSPLIRKVKKGSHVFQVRASAEGTVDSTPATREWKVKKKKRK